MYVCPRFVTAGAVISVNVVGKGKGLVGLYIALLYNLGAR
jgi:hypothetical protein